MFSSSDSNGFSKLFSGSRAALRRYVRRLVNSREATDEIVQEAFLRTYEHSEDVRTPRAFLFSIARNLAFKTKRHDEVVRANPFDAMGALQAEGAHQSPEDALLSDERIRLLREAVERLPAQCRAAFVLKVFYDHSYEEIADKLGIKKKTVENHISAALRSTSGYLKRRFEDAR